MKSALLRALMWLGGASREVAEFLMPLFRDSLARMLAGLLPIALEVVRGLMDSPASGKEKQAEAARAIQQMAVHEGLVVTSRAINMAIELALEKLVADGEVGRVR